MGKSTVRCPSHFAPYATALPYIDTDRLSIYALGLDDVDKRRGLEWSMIGNREIRERQRLDLERNSARMRMTFQERLSPTYVPLSPPTKPSGSGFADRTCPPFVPLLRRYEGGLYLGTGSAGTARHSVRSLSATATRRGSDRVRIRTADSLCSIGQQLGFGYRGADSHGRPVRVLTPSAELHSRRRDSSVPGTSV